MGGRRLQAPDSRRTKAKALRNQGPQAPVPCCCCCCPRFAIIHSAQLSLSAPSTTTFSSGSRQLVNLPEMEFGKLKVKHEMKLEPAETEAKKHEKLKTDSKNADVKINKMTQKLEKRVKQEMIDQHKIELPTVDNANNSSSNSRRQCRCRIDLSSPAALERDFMAWLKQGMDPPVCNISRPCLFNGTHSPPPFPLPNEQQLQMLSLTEYHHHHAIGAGAINHFVELPAFLAPSDCSMSASSLSSSASASSSSISPGGTNCCSFSSSIDTHHSSSSYPIACQSNPTFGQLKPLPEQTFVGPIGTGKVTLSGTRMRRKRNVDKASGRGTNLYGRSYCPGRPLSMEERAQIIHLFHGGMKVNAISKQLCISHGCVSKIITRFRETGNLMPSSHSECRRRKRQQQQLLQQQMLQQQQQHEQQANMSK